VDDVLQLWEVLDCHQTVLPTFVAANISRMPRFEPAATDICSLATIVEDLRRQLATVGLTAKLEEVCCSKAICQADWPPLPTQLPLLQSISSPAAALAPQDVVAVSAPGVGRFCSNSATEGQSKPASGNRRSVVVKGKQVTNNKATCIQGVQRRLTAFVGRLKKETTADDMLVWMSVRCTVGLQDRKCTRLEPRNGRVFNTAAFRVSCSAESRDIFYNEDSWSLGVELRDWIFYESKASSRETEVNSTRLSHVTE